jgi:hypothetical protein
MSGACGKSVLCLVRRKKNVVDLDLQVKSIGHGAMRVVYSPAIQVEASI